MIKKITTAVLGSIFLLISQHVSGQNLIKISVCEATIKKNNNLKLFLLYKDKLTDIDLISGNNFVLKTNDLKLFTDSADSFKIVIASGRYAYFIDLTKAELHCKNINNICLLKKKGGCWPYNLYQCGDIGVFGCAERKLIKNYAPLHNRNVSN